MIRLMRRGIYFLHSTFFLYRQILPLFFNLSFCPFLRNINLDKSRYSLSSLNFSWWQIFASFYFSFFYSYFDNHFSFLVMPFDKEKISTEYLKALAIFQGYECEGQRLLVRFPDNPINSSGNITIRKPAATVAAPKPVPTKGWVFKIFILNFCQNVCIYCEKLNM